MSCCKNYCVPKFVSTGIEIDQMENTATIKVCGELPECPGRFDVCLIPCAGEVCSSAKVYIKDSAGDTVRVFNLHANEAKLGQVSVQAARHGILHLVRSTDLPHNALWLDKVSCVPTPVTNITSASFSTNTSSVNSFSASSKTEK